MSRPAVLVVAKAPVAGQVKTRLAATVGDVAAAQLAAASLLDTLDICADTFDHCMLALTGDLDAAVAGEQIAHVLKKWTVFPQLGEGLAERLEHAHSDAHAACQGPVVQVGMDTPHMSRAELKRVAAPLANDEADAVLGYAHDGGWWVLGLAHPRWAAGLRWVAMSSPRTGALTQQHLQRNGARLSIADTLRDIDTAEDADAVFGRGFDRATSTRFGNAWHDLSPASAT